MSTGQLTPLETKIENLLSAIENLKQENQNLRQQMAFICSEHGGLQEKCRKAILQIKQLVTHLKAGAG